MNGAELAIVIPTFNELDNISELVQRLDTCMKGVDWEAIFVDDDSPDLTAARVRLIAQQDHRVRVVHRVGRRGLSTACIEGMLSSSAPYLAVMDADLQHDEGLLPTMLAELKARKGLDIVVGSRYVDGGGMGDWAVPRARMSQIATRLAHVVLKADLQDPMSGFFMLRRPIFQDALPHLSGIGFKILLDILASSPEPIVVKELPYTFRSRLAGQSKLDSLVVWQYFMLLLDKTVGRYVPVRFVTFAFVGGLGVFFHMALLWTLFSWNGVSFGISQTVATLATMSLNFFANNAMTYRDRQLKGWGLLRGWISFTLACSVGAISNVGVAAYLFDQQRAGWALSALAGILIGAVWNYAVTSVYTWNRSTR